MKLITSLALLLIASTSMAQGVPNTFTAGTPALAAEVNANFTDLDTRTSTNTTNIALSLGGLTLTQVPVRDGSGVAGAQCPVNSLVGSANCFCDGDGITTNFGLLVACQIAGNGGVAGCFPVGLVFDPNLPSAVADLNLICVSGVQNDGTPIVPTFSKGDPLFSSKIDNSEIEFETAVNNARTKVADYTSALQNR